MNQGQQQYQQNRAPPQQHSNQPQQLPPQQLQPRNNQNNANDNGQVKEEFFNQFGKYESKKDKLKNDLHQEYNDYLMVRIEDLFVV